MFEGLPIYQDGITQSHSDSLACIKTHIYSSRQANLLGMSFSPAGH